MGRAAVNVWSRTDAGYDSAGRQLPADFNSSPVTYGYTGADLTTIVRTAGGYTYTKTLTYASGVVTAESAWVRS
jgi:hypothetical protein